MSWFGYIWIVILMIIYAVWTVKWWKDAIIEKDFKYIIAWIVPQLFLVFLASLIYFCWQKGW